MIRFAKNLKTFLRDQRGNAGLIFGLSAIPLLAAGGAGMDFANYLSARTMLQSSIDAAALAAAGPELKTDAERIEVAKAFFAANLATGAASKLPFTANFVIQDGKVVGSGSVDVDMHFISFAGPSELTATGGAEVGIAIDKKAEIALVLDYSGSMGEAIDGGVKYEIMKDATTKLVEDLGEAAPDKVKFGLVPFSHQVYTTLPGSYVRGAKTSTWTGCTVDRKYPYNLEATTPMATINDSKWGQPQSADFPTGCSGYVKNNLKTVDLTDDFDSITNQLAVMTPYSYTHIALGVEFGYHMLTPNAPFTKGAPMNDGETEKFLVVLTDGKQTAYGYGPGKSYGVAQGEENLEALCQNAKDDGITVISMAFDLDDSGTRQRLKNCASDPEKGFFIANSADDLSGAFEAVKAAVTAQVYLSK